MLCFRVPYELGRTNVTWVVCMGCINKWTLENTADLPLIKVPMVNSTADDRPLFNGWGACVGGTSISFSS